MKVLVLFFLLIMVLYTQAQSCYEPAYAYKFGGNQIAQRITFAERRADGLIVVLGDCGSAALNLGGVSVPAGTTNGHFLALMDSSGTFIQAVRVTSGTTTVRDMCLAPDGSIYITAGGDVTLTDGQLPGVIYSDQMFVMKFNPDFAYAWHRFSTWIDADAEGWAVACDADGNIFCGGTFSANALVIGEDYVWNYGCYNCWSGDGFIFKLNETGEFQWMRSIGSTADERVATLTCDSNGDVWATGAASALTTYNGVFSFDENYTTKGGNTGINMFIAKYDGDNGRCLHGELTQQGYGTGQIYAIDAVLGAEDDLYLAGRALGQISAGEGATFNADGDGFVMHIGADYGDRWVRTMGGQNSSEQANSIDFLNGKVAVSGALWSNQVYFADYPAHVIVNGNTAYAFNGVFYADGSVDYARVYNAGSSNSVIAAATVFDAGGNAIVMGNFSSTVTFQSTSLTATGGNANLFVLKYVPAPVSAFSMTAGPDKSITCGVGVQLSGATTPGTITGVGWWPNLGFSFNTSKTPYVAPTRPTDYVMYAYYQGCVLRDTVHVNVTNYNGLTANAGPDAGFCVGDSIQLSGSSNDPAATLSWQPNIGISSITAANPFAKPNTSTDYVLEATVGNCKAYDTVRVEVRQKPNIYLPVDDLSFGYPRFHLCAGSTEPVNMGSPDYTYTLISDTPASGWNNNNALTIDNSGLLTVQATAPNGCTARDSTFVVYAQNQPPPPIVSNIPASRSVCEGDTVKVSAFLTTSVAYDPYDFQFSWYGGWQVDSLDGQGWRDIEFYDVGLYDEFLYSWGQFNSAYYADLLIRNVQTSGLKYRAYINDFCSDRAYTNVMTVYVGPKISQQPPVSKVICTGLTDSISVNSTALNAAYQWQVRQNGVWSNVVTTPGVIVPNGRWLRFYNVQAGLDSLYRCLVTGCTENSTVASDSAVVRVGISPQVLSQTPTHEVCENTNSFLTFHTNDGPFQYQWYQNNTALTFNTAQYSGYNNDTLFFPTMSTSQNIYTYKCRIYNTQCAVEAWTDTVRFQVQPAPNVTWPVGAQTVCVSETAVPLTGGNPTGGVYYGPFVTGTQFNAAAAGVGAYTMTYTKVYSYPNTAFFCVDSAQVPFNVVPLPVVALSFSEPDFCLGDDDFPLTGGSPSGGSYYGAPPFPQAVQNNIFQLESLASGAYTIGYSYTDANGCAASDEDVLTVHNLPEVNWDFAAFDACADDLPVTLNEGMPAGGVYTGAGLTGYVFDPADAGEGAHPLLYTVTDQFGCSAAAGNTATVYPLPEAQWSAGNYTYCVDDDDQYVLSWLFNCSGTPLFAGEGVQDLGGGQFFVPSSVGSIGNVEVTATCTSGDGCEVTLSKSFTIETCVGTSSPAFSSTSVTAANGLITVETGQSAQVSVFNGLGQQVHAEEISGSATLRTGVLPAGVYFVQVRIGGVLKGFRVVVV